MLSCSSLCAGSSVGPRIATRTHESTLGSRLTMAFEAFSGQGQRLGIAHSTGGTDQPAFAILPASGELPEPLNNAYAMRDVVASWVLMLDGNNGEKEVSFVRACDVFLTNITLDISSWELREHVFTVSDVDTMRKQEERWARDYRKLRRRRLAFEELSKSHDDLGSVASQDDTSEEELGEAMAEVSLLEEEEQNEADMAPPAPIELPPEPIEVADSPEAKRRRKRTKGSS